MQPLYKCLVVEAAGACLLSAWLHGKATASLILTQASNKHNFRIEC